MLRDPGQVHDKTGLANYVTDRDVEIQQYLIKELSAQYSGCHFYGEEETGGNDRKIQRMTCIAMFFAWSRSCPREAAGRTRLAA